MNNYETMFVVSTDQTEEVINAQVDKYTGIITNNGGIVDDIKHWGKRRLAYAINYKNEGYYVLINFHADAELITELERNYNIDENMMRFIVIRKEETAAPAATEEPSEEPAPAVEPVAAEAE